MIPASVWRTSFGDDRAGLIGHKLNPDKLEAKLPRNYSNFDMQLSLLEPLFISDDASPWIFSTKTPSLADISLFYQLTWGLDVAAGRGIANLTGGGTNDTNTDAASVVFNKRRYPAIHRWYTELGEYFSKLPLTEDRLSSPTEALQRVKSYRARNSAIHLVPTPNKSHEGLDANNGLVPGVLVSVAPDHTGRDDPTMGTLLAVSPEEVVIKPREIGRPAPIDVRIHFLRLGFVVQPWREAKL